MQEMHRYEKYFICTYEWDMQMLKSKLFFFSFFLRLIHWWYPVCATEKAKARTGSLEPCAVNVANISCFCISAWDRCLVVWVSRNDFTFNYKSLWYTLFIFKLNSQWLQDAQVMRLQNNLKSPLLHHCVHHLFWGCSAERLCCVSSRCCDQTSPLWSYLFK